MNQTKSTLPCYECGFEYNEHNLGCHATRDAKLTNKELLDCLLKAFKYIQSGGADTVEMLEIYNRYRRAVEFRMTAPPESLQVSLDKNK